MDPITALDDALDGNRQAARDYNDWVARGGYRARVELDPALDLWMMGIRYVNVDKVGTAYVHGTHDNGRKVRVSIGRVDIVR